MEPVLIVSIIVALLIIVTVAQGVRLVPQGSEWVVERLGRYRCTIQPGLNLLIPYLDSVSHKMSTKDILLPIDKQEIITLDNVTILTTAVCYLKVVDPCKAAYGVDDYAEAIRNLTSSSLRSIIGEMDLDQALSARVRIKNEMREIMSEQASDWGITVIGVEIMDIQPSESMQMAMERQAAAERERKASVTVAEGHKTAAILAADARLESAKRDGEAQVTLARASAEAIVKIREAVGESSGPMMYMLGERYISAMEKLGASSNAKVVVLPADIHETIRGMLGGNKG